jgi:hypothetical protein
MVFVVVDVDVKVPRGVVILSSTALVLWHPGTNRSGKHDFLIGSNAKFSWHDCLPVTLSEHSK